jgi:hypothetical protein
MRKETFDDEYLNDDFDESWDSETDEWGDDEELNTDDISFDIDDIEDNPSWMEEIEDPDLLNDFDLDDELNFDD